MSVGAAKSSGVGLALQSSFKLGLGAGALYSHTALALFAGRGLSQDGAVILSELVLVG